MAENTHHAGLTALNKVPYSRNEIAELVERSRWMQGFPYYEIEQLAKFISVYQANKGMVVFQEGAREIYLCLLLEGQIEIQKENATHKEKTLAVIQRGRAFGEMSLIDGQPRSASAVAAEDSLIVVLPQHDFLRLIEEQPRLAAKLLLKLGAIMSQRLRQTSGVLIDYIQ